MQTYSKTKIKQIKEINLTLPNILELARAELGKRTSFRLQISGNSMNPTIFDGDYITVEKIISSKLRNGDIVLVASVSDTALVHRIVKIEETKELTTIITRADGANCQDVPVPITNVVGRVSLIERKDRMINLNNPLHRLLARFYSFLARFRRQKD